jgi:hypothetical protein
MENTPTIIHTGTQVARLMITRMSWKLDGSGCGWNVRSDEKEERGIGIDRREIV